MEQSQQHSDIQQKPQAKGVTIQDIKRWACIAFLIVCGFILISFIVANWQSADITLLPFTQPVSIPLCVALVIAFISGWIIGTLTILLRQRRR